MPTDIEPAPRIRLATGADAARMVDIYAPSVLDGAISFESELPSEQEFQRRIEAKLAELPWLVCEVGGRVAGFAYAGPHHERGAYGWSLDTAVYIDVGHHRRGIGRALYTALFGCLRLQGYYNLYACITVPNDASVSMHESMGFEQVGLHRNVGHKLGAWRDVGWWHLALQAHAPDPAEPLAMAEVLDTQAWRAAIEAGEASLRL